MKRLHNLILILLLLPCLATAGIVKGKYTKEKKLNKAYIVNNNAGLQIGNKYGNIAVVTWDEDKTEIEVVITVSGNKEEDVNRRLNSIEVEFAATKSLVSARTQIGNFRGRNISMEINYTVKIPRNGTLGLNNQYGGITLGKINGGMNIDCQYGGLNIDQANAENNNINLQYCSSSRINYIKAAKMDVQYSVMNITKAGKITARFQYTPLKITDVGDINLSIDYGDLRIDSADKINVKAEYTVCKYGRVDNLLNTSVNYGDIQVNQISASARSVVINSSYGSNRLNFAPDAGFNFEFKLAYGNMQGKDLLKFTEKSEKDFSSYYKGTSARGNGECKVYVSAEYGDIKINRN